MKGVYYFPEQRGAIKTALDLIGKLPPDTVWSLWVSHDQSDSTLNIYVLPDEVKVYRMTLGLHNYIYKSDEYVTYYTDGLIVSLIEQEKQ